jgi:hypothetical protein
MQGSRYDLVALLLFLAVLVGFPKFVHRNPPRFEGPAKVIQQQVQEEGIRSQHYGVLILGHSRAHYGICPQDFPCPTFNYAFHSETYAEDLRKLRKVQRMGNMPNGLILSIDPFSFADPDPLSGQVAPERKGFPDRLDALPETLQDFENRTKNSVATRYQVPFQLKLKERLTRWQNPEARFPEIKPDGQLVVYRTGSENQTVKRNTKVRPEQYAALMEILYLADSTGCRVALVQLPSLSSERRNYSGQQLQDYHTLVGKVQTAWPMVIYYDYSENEYFTPGDFFDATHLNNEGAHKLTKLLVNVLKRDGFFRMNRD